MLTQGEDVEAHALRQRGWSISAIARHLDRDRKTVRAYLNGERQPGRAARRRPRIRWPGSCRYLRARFADDCHLWATALFDEVVPLGYDRSYPTFARQLRERGLRPHCEACRGGASGGTRSRSIIRRVRRSSGTGSNDADAPWGAHRLRPAGDVAAFGPHPWGAAPSRSTRPI